MTGPLFPENFSRIWVRGRFVTLNGDPIAGKLTMAPNVSGGMLVNRAAGLIISTTPFSATSQPNTGYVAVQVPATDDPDVTPIGFTYTVTTPISRSYPIVVPYDTPVLNLPGDPLHGQQVIELIDVVPAPGPSGGTAQLLRGVGIASMALVAGELVVTYDDGDTQNLGPVPTGLDAEAVRDAIGVALVGVGNVAVTVNDAADTITVSTTATANSTDAQLRDRATHTGEQAIATVTGLGAALDGLPLRADNTNLAGAAVGDLLAVTQVSPLTVGHTVGVGFPVTQRAVRKIRRDAEDVFILNCSDSTGFYSSGEPRFFYKLAVLLAADYPAHTVKFVRWDDTAQNWATALTIQTGTGLNTVWFYNAAVSGSRGDYFLASRFSFVRDLQPDLIFTNYGLNDGSTDLVGAKNYGRERAIMLAESLIAATPQAGLVILSQTERTDVVNDVQRTRAARYEVAAEQCGRGFIDTRQVFAEDSRGLAALLNADGIHPNNVGSDLLADTLYQRMRYRPELPPGVTPPSAFHRTGPNLLINGDFASFAAPPALTGWTATNATLTKDATNFEGPNGYSVNLVAAGAAAQSFINQDLNLRTVRGQWVTVATRQFIAAGQPTTAGRTAIQCGDGADFTSPTFSVARDGWLWTVVCKRIPFASTFARVRVYADTGTSTTATASFDRVIASLGQLPRDVR